MGGRKYLSEKLEHNTLNPNHYFNPLRAIMAPRKKQEIMT